MDASFWHERWATGQIGFHEGKPNSFLERFASVLDGAARVLVPLCGKTEDLAYLASRGHQVVGLELVEDAVRAFFAEHDLVPSREVRGEHVVYSANGITLIAGDALAVTRELVGSIDAIYDRAAVVALPPDVRPRYVAGLRALVAPRARVLLLAFEYDQSLRGGPPFAVMPDEIRTLYAGAEITELATDSDTKPFDHVERCYQIQLP